MPRTDSDTKRGAYQKFDVSRTDGSSGVGEKHEHCTYFVLDLNHDPCALPALAAYAKACKPKYPKLARDLAMVVESRNPAEAMEDLIREPSGR